MLEADVDELEACETVVAPLGPMLKVPVLAKTLLIFPTSTSSRVYPSLTHNQWSSRFFPVDLCLPNRDDRQRQRLLAKLRHDVVGNGESVVEDIVG